MQGPENGLPVQADEIRGTAAEQKQGLGVDPVNDHAGRLQGLFLQAAGDQILFRHPQKGDAAMQARRHGGELNHPPAARRNHKQGVALRQ